MNHIPYRKTPNKLHKKYLSDIGSMNFLLTLRMLEAVVQKCSLKKVFLEIWQNSQESICASEAYIIFQKFYFPVLGEDK